MPAEHKPFQLDMITPQQTVYSGEITALTVPAEEGYMGIMANHAPLITHVRRGKVKVQKTSGEILQFALTGDGFLEVYKNQARLLVDAVENVSP
jgi:F-type H+-transporting ATPase subunit epsilon